MCQLVGATFYLFGLIFFLALPLVTRVLDDSRTSLDILILNDFVMYFAYASNVFFVFLLLHCVQWLVSSRLQACALRLNP
jgi:hypothetical protein